MNILIISALETLGLWYATRGSDHHRISTFVAVNMMLVVLFSQKLFVLFGLTTNVANIFYATVVLAQVLTLYKYGQEAALHTIRLTLFAVLSMLLLSSALAAFPVVQGDEGISAAVSLITNTSLYVVFASLFAFVIAQAVLVRLLDTFSYTKAAIAVTVTQLVDSLVFFPIAFYNTPISELYTIAVSGFLFKVIITSIILVPLLPILWNTKNTQK